MNIRESYDDLFLALLKSEVFISVILFPVPKLFINLCATLILSFIIAKGVGQLFSLLLSVHFAKLMLFNNAPQEKVKQKEAAQSKWERVIVKMKRKGRSLSFGLNGNPSFCGWVCKILNFHSHAAQTLDINFCPCVCDIENERFL